MSENNLIELVVEYSEKDNLDKSCRIWNAEKKAFFSTSQEDIIKYGRIDLFNASYEDKDDLKELKAKFDYKNKVWYTSNSNMAIKEKYAYYDLHKKLIKK